jgi:hypothetical protein
MKCIAALLFSVEMLPGLNYMGAAGLSRTASPPEDGGNAMSTHESQLASRWKGDAALQK